MIIHVILFAIGLLLLIKGGDWFVDGATAIAQRYHVPEIIIGATIVSIGTTLPEVMVSATGAVSGQSAMAYGNAIGSVICNTALIAAVTIAVRPAPVNVKAMKLPVAFFFGAAAFFCLCAYVLGDFPRWAGLVLLAGFVAYMITTIRQGFRSPAEAAGEAEEESSEQAPIRKTLMWAAVLICGLLFSIFNAANNVEKIVGIVALCLYALFVLVDLIVKNKASSFLFSISLLIAGAAVIAQGAQLLVNHGTEIAYALKVPESVIALTFVALGTSLPELVTAITSLVKGHGALSLGNIIGANLFNLVLVLGVSVGLAPFGLPEGSALFGLPASLVLEIPVMLVVMSIMVIPAMLRKKLSRVQGIVLLLIYAGFCALQFTM